MKSNRQMPMLPRGHLPVVQPDQGADKVRFPDMADLMARLRFSTSDGRIWLDDQRMLLVHAKALGSLRREMNRSRWNAVRLRLECPLGYGPWAMPISVCVAAFLYVYGFRA